MNEREMNMSDQAIGAVMMALQKSLQEQRDIVQVLQGFRFRLSEMGLMIMNPPLVKFNEGIEENLQQSFAFDETYDEQMPETD